MNPIAESAVPLEEGAAVSFKRWLGCVPVPARVTGAALVAGGFVTGVIHVIEPLGNGTLLVAGTAVCLVSGALGYSVWRWVTLPAKAMLNTVLARQRGDGQVVAEIFDQDTLGQLAGALNTSFVSFEKNQRALAESESLFRCLAEGIGQVFWVTTPDRSKILYISPAFANVWGRSCDSLYRRNTVWLEAIHPDDRERVFLACGRTDELFDLEYRVLRPDGSTRWVHDRMFRVRDQSLGDTRRVGISEDITERRNAEEKFRLMFEQSADAHLLIADEHIVDCNPAAIDLLKAEGREQILGLALAELLPAGAGNDTSFVRMSLRLQLSAAERGRHRFDWTLRTLEGRLLPVEATLTRVALSGKAHLLLVWHDISDRLHAEDTLRQEKDMAEHALAEVKSRVAQWRTRAEIAERTTQAKSEFLLATTHDLRAPLNDLIGFTDVLLGANPTDHQLAALRPLRDSADGLITILDDLIDYTKIEAGQLRLSPISFNLADSLQDVHRLLAPRAQAKGLLFTLSIAEEVPQVLLGDPLRVRQVLFNLTSNAIKYTRAGHVRINVRVARTDAHRNAEEDRTGSPFCEFVTFSVTDSGIGVSRERLNQLFTPHAEGEAAGPRPAHLGLTIARSLVDRMGGSIGAQSDEGIGSTFWFTLPILASSLPTRHPLPTAETASVSPCKS